MNTLQSLSRTHIAARPDCAAYLPAIDGPIAPKGAAALANGSANGVFAHLPEMAPLAAPETQALTDAIIAARDDLDWWSAYADDDPTPGRNYAARTCSCLLTGAGPEGRAGFFYLREGVEYELHAHAPDEIYAILAGRARFRTDAGWREAGAGEVIHTPSWSWHGMETTLGPVLILWAWVGNDLDAPPRFRAQD